jgi:hypothetical protein
VLEPVDAVSLMRQQLAGVAVRPCHRKAARCQWMIAVCNRLDYDDPLLAAEAVLLADLLLRLLRRSPRAT